MSKPVPTTFDAGQPQEVAITPDPVMEARKRRKERLAEQMAEARVFEQFGTKILKVRMKTLAAIGSDVERLGVKQIGHGKIALAGENAHIHIERLGDLVHELQSRTPPVDPSVIVDAMALVRAFNEQLMESGKAHINADKQPAVSNTSNTLSVPFPAGTPLMIGVAPQKPVTVDCSKP
jgi:hypothetical protein